MAFQQCAFDKMVMEASRAAGDFKPEVIHDPDIGSIEFIAEPDSFYGKWINHWLTIYYSRETNEVIGVLIDGRVFHA